MHKDEQNVWNFLFAILFVALFFGSFGIILTIRESVPLSIPLFDAVLIALASFRLVRLVEHDMILQFFRDLFLNVKSVPSDGRVERLIRSKPAEGPRRTVTDLINCSWCLGLWMGWSVTFLYLISPLAWYPIFVLAIGGVASILQVLASLMGWRTEETKLEVRAIETS